MDRQICNLEDEEQEQQAENFESTARNTANYYELKIRNYRGRYESQ